MDSTSLKARVGKFELCLVIALRLVLKRVRLGFHIPPYNSVDHLHLHAHGLPYKSPWRRAKYPFAPGQKGKEKGFSWFVEVEQAIRILESGRSVGVMPC